MKPHFFVHYLGIVDVTYAYSRRLNPFSAVCFLFARSMTDRLSPEGENKRVFGLIHSSWSGNSRIESFMSQDALDACSVEPNVEPGDGSHNSNSYVWNAMVNPFLRHNVYGVLWYQGVIKQSTFVFVRVPFT